MSLGLSRVITDNVVAVLLSKSNCPGVELEAGIVLGKVIDRGHDIVINLSEKEDLT
jgi:hypothetical protein